MPFLAAVPAAVWGGIAAAGTGALISGLTSGGGSIPGKAGAKEAKRQFEKRWPYTEPILQQQVRRGEFGQSFYPGLRSYLESPTTTPLFNAYSQYGQNVFRDKFAPVGTANQFSAAKYLKALELSERARQQEMLMRAAGFQGVNSGDAAAAGRAGVSALASGSAQPNTLQSLLGLGIGAWGGAGAPGLSQLGALIKGGPDAPYEY